MLLFAFVAFADPLPDLGKDVSRASCITPPTGSKPHPGAEQFYVAAYNVATSGEVSGFEKRYTYGNDTWKALDGLRAGEDCVDVWTVVGKKTSPIDCKTCDFALEFKADVDTSKTNCKRRLTDNMNHFSTVYNVKVNGTVAEVLFRSGKPLGKGTFENDVLTWRSPQTCVWF